MNTEEMYQEIILEEYRKPRNFGTLQHPTVSMRDSNPACGDVCEMHVAIKNNQINDIKFNGKGCAISIASASLLTEYSKNKSLEEIKQLTKEDALELLGIELSGIRTKCALLPFKVLKLAVYHELGEHYDQ